MKHLKENLDWKSRWEERGEAVWNVLGDTFPPRSVIPFSWKNYILPGACALTFGPTSSRDYYMYISLGLSQPLEAADPAYPWEFAVCASEYGNWPGDLLYQLVTQWLWVKGNMGFGYYLPLVFFTDAGGNLWAGVTEDLVGLQVVGSIRGLYLWTDDRHPRFEVSSGDFGLLTVIAVTSDEDRNAQETSPAHLMLLFKEMGLSQVCDPYRQSIFTRAEASRAWNKIRVMTHEDAFEQQRRL